MKVKNRGAIIIAVAALAALFALSAAIYVVRHPQGNAPTQEESAESADPANEGSEGEDHTSPALSDEQKKLIESYDSATSEMTAVLKANVWVSKGDGSALTFSDEVMTESSGTRGEQVTHTYAISALDKDTSSESGANGETVDVTEYTLALLTDDGTHILTIRKTSSSADESSAVMVASSDLLEYASAYTLDHASGEVTVSGLNSEFTTLFGLDSQGLTKLLSDHCAVYYPTATTAKWSGTATVDYEDSTVSTTFKLDTATNTSLEVIYNTTTKEYFFN